MGGKEEVKVNDEAVKKGRKIVERILYPERFHCTSELTHYGIKGMKWGVRRSPEQLGHIAKYKKNAIMDYVDNHRSINTGKQVRHVQEKYIKGRSHLYGKLEYAQRLIDELSGTGELKFDRHGNWVNKEIVTSDKLIGTYVNPDTGEEIPSNRAVIVYSKTGSHIYPVRPLKKEK